MSISPIRVLRRRYRKIRRARERADWQEIKADREALGGSRPIRRDQYRPRNPIHAVRRRLRRRSRARENEAWSGRGSDGGSNAPKVGSSKRIRRAWFRGVAASKRTRSRLTRLPRRIWRKRPRPLRWFNRRRRAQKRTEERADWAQTKAARAGAPAPTIASAELATSRGPIHRWRSERHKRKRTKELDEWRAAVTAGEEEGDYPDIKTGGKTLKRRVQYRTRRLRRRFRALPKVAQIAAVLVTATAVTMASIVAYNRTIGKDTALGEDFAGLLNDPNGDKVKVLVIGDGSAYSMAADVGGVYSERGILGSAFAQFNCSLIPGPAVVGDRDIAQPSDCASYTSNFLDVMQSTKPDVVVLMLGSGEALARRVGGRVIAAQSSDLEQQLGERLNVIRAAAERGNARMRIATLPCPVVNVGNRVDTSRQWVNDVFRRYAAANPSTVAIAEVGDVACPNGTVGNAPDGSPLMEGFNFTAIGVETIWAALAKDAIAAERSDPQRESTTTASSQPE